MRKYKLYMEWDNGWSVERIAEFKTQREAENWKNYFLEREEKDVANFGNKNLASVFNKIN